MIIDHNIASRLKIIAREDDSEVVFQGKEQIVLGVIPCGLDKYDFAHRLATIIRDLPSYIELLEKSNSTGGDM